MNKNDIPTLLAAQQDGQLLALQSICAAMLATHPEKDKATLLAKQIVTMGMRLLLSNDAQVACQNLLTGITRQAEDASKMLESTEKTL